MTIATMLRTAALATLLIWTAPAMAQVTGSLPPAPASLKRAVTVTSNVVRIGDLVDNAGANASVPIFRAPDLGMTGTVPISQVLEALRTHDLLAVSTNGIEGIEVTRSGRAISVKEIEARILRAFSGQFRATDPKNAVVNFDREVQSIYVEPTITSDLQVTNASFDPRSGRFDITIDIPGSMVTKRANLRFTGSLVEMVETPVLTRALARGDLVKASDITIARKSRADLKGDPGGSAEQLIGLEARVAIAAGEPLRRVDLVKPDRIKRDESVTLIYEVPGILLTCRGKALEAGADGDVISVLNVQSKRTVQGTVSGPGRVVVADTSARIAANTPVTAVPR
jgi:flagellar basal body P-ring formation protein FlgA